MGPAIIARNYADTLLTLARRHGGDEAVREFERALNEVANVLAHEPRLRVFLETPRITEEAKKQVIRDAFGDRVPEPFLRFLLIVVEKRRQGLLQRIAAEYRVMVDEARNLARAEVRLAREPDARLRDEIQDALEARLGRTVISTYRVDPSILGGVVVRVQDRILDGSVRRGISGLRRRLLDVALPDSGA